jgi:hypothetical protein
MVSSRLYTTESNSLRNLPDSISNLKGFHRKAPAVVRGMVTTGAQTNFDVRQTIFDTVHTGGFFITN